jgi:hypothetical protein
VLPYSRARDGADRGEDRQRGKQAGDDTEQDRGADTDQTYEAERKQRPADGSECPSLARSRMPDRRRSPGLRQPVVRFGTARAVLGLSRPLRARPLLATQPSRPRSAMRERPSLCSRRVRSHVAAQDRPRARHLRASLHQKDHQPHPRSVQVRLRGLRASKSGSSAAEPSEPRDQGRTEGWRDRCHGHLESATCVRLRSGRADQQQSSCPQPYLASLPA